MTQLIFDYVLCHHTTHFYVSTFDYTTKLDMELLPVLLILTEAEVFDNSSLFEVYLICIYQSAQSFFLLTRDKILLAEILAL